MRCMDWFQRAMLESDYELYDDTIDLAKIVFDDIDLETPFVARRSSLLGFTVSLLGVIYFSMSLYQCSSNSPQG
mgnify:CR=1 FL=1